MNHDEKTLLSLLKTVARGREKAIHVNELCLMAGVSTNGNGHVVRKLARSLIINYNQPIGRNRKGLYYIEGKADLMSTLRNRLSRGLANLKVSYGQLSMECEG